MVSSHLPPTDESQILSPIPSHSIRWYEKFEFDYSPECLALSAAGSILTIIKPNANLPEWSKGARLGRVAHNARGFESHSLQ